MKIPHLRFIAPAVVVVVAAVVYIGVAQPFAQNEPENTTDSEATILDYRLRASAYLEEGKNAEALELLLKLEVMTPEDVAVHYAVAVLYKMAGQKAEAKAALERGMPYLTDPDANAAYAKLLTELE